MILFSSIIECTYKCKSVLLRVWAHDSVKYSTVLMYLQYWEVFLSTKYVGYRWWWNYSNVF